MKKHCTALHYTFTKPAAQCPWNQTKHWLSADFGGKGEHGTLLLQRGIINYGLPLFMGHLFRADVLSFLNLGVFKNLHVLLRKRINDADKIRSQEPQNGNF